MNGNAPGKIIKLIVILLPLSLGGFLLGYLTASQKNFLPPKDDTTLLPPSDFQDPSFIEYTFKQGDTFFQVLTDLDIPPQEIFELMKASKKPYLLKRVDPGNTMTLKINPVTPTVERLEYTIDNQHLLTLVKEDRGYRASVEKLSLDIKLRTITGSIRSSLFEDGSAVGCPPQLILNFADIFAWDVDFLSDLRTNDSFTLVFEEMYKDGAFVKYGKILAATLTNQEKRLWAFYFQDTQGGAEYYNEKGESVSKMFLKSPLRYSRISSPFSKRRLHPILRIYRPHLGVDYAAPTGTPVEATADGKVTQVGRKGGYGKCITIQHNTIFTSFYGHLSRFARGITHHQRVTQGQVIGYVGASGLATGPHLDYRLTQNNSFVDPLKLVSSRRSSLRKACRAEFEKNKLQLMVLMEGYEETQKMAQLHTP